MNVHTFKAICVHHHTFAVPQLPDMLYGTFIYFSTDGQCVKYYTGIDDSVWEFVDALLEKNAKKLKSRSKGKIIQRVIGLIADAPEKGVHFTTDIICPRCQATVQTMDVSKSLESMNIQALTFDDFNSLTDNQIEERISVLIKNLPLL